MKKLTAFLFFLLLVPALQAADVKLQWTASASPGVTCYKVYQGTASRIYDAPVKIGNVTSYTAKNVPDGTYFWAVTACDDQGNESAFSNEVTKTVRTIQPPADLSVEIQLTITISAKVP